MIGADGSEVFYEDGDRIRVAPLTTSPALAIGTPKTLYDVPFMNTSGRRFDVDPDGRRILIIKEDPLVPFRRPELMVILNWGEQVRTACLR